MLELTGSHRGRQAGSSRSKSRLEAARRSPLFIASVEKCFAILQTFPSCSPDQSLTEIAHRTGFPKSAVQRFLHTMTGLGLLDKDDRTKRYRLSLRVLDLGLAFLQADGLVELANPSLVAASRACGETVNLIQMDDIEVVYVARIPNRHVASIDILLGSRLPTFCTSSGRAMLAFMPPGDAKDILDRSDRQPLTPMTITDYAQILERLARIREDGYELTDQECFLGDLSIAAPVFDAQGSPCAAVNVSVPTVNWSKEALVDSILPVIQTASQEISCARGWRGQPVRVSAKGRP